jgi:hypothetical protein
MSAGRNRGDAQSRRKETLMTADAIPARLESTADIAIALIGVPRRPEPDGDGPAARIFEDGPHNREAARDEQRGTQTLEHSSGEQRRHRRRGPADKRAEGEDRDPQEEQSLAPTSIAEYAARQEEAGVHGHVRVDDPLLIGRVGVQLLTIRGSATLTAVVDRTARNRPPARTNAASHLA